MKKAKTPTELEKVVRRIEHARSAPDQNKAQELRAVGEILREAFPNGTTYGAHEYLQIAQKLGLRSEGMLRDADSYLKNVDDDLHDQIVRVKDQTGKSAFNLDCLRLVSGWCKHRENHSLASEFIDLCAKKNWDSARLAKELRRSRGMTRKLQAVKSVDTLFDRVIKKFDNFANLGEIDLLLKRLGDGPKPPATAQKKQLEKISARCEKLAAELEARAKEIKNSVRGK